MNYRKYGSPPYALVLLHGGPGAAGDLAFLSAQLSGSMGTIEALQTCYSIDALIEETRDIITSQAQIPVTLAGHSWGAWLGILVAERYPELVQKLILISSGPFEISYVRNIMPLRLQRLSRKTQVQLSDLTAELNGDGSDKDHVFKKIGDIISSADVLHEIRESASNSMPNYKQYEAIWPAAAQLRDSGELLQSASNVQCPLIAIHGDYDPHPAEGVRLPLSGRVRDFTFILLNNCGHYPWREVKASQEFIGLIRKLTSQG